MPTRLHPGGALAAAAVALVLWASVATGEASSQPNIIVILADDLGVETLGTYGGTSYETPELDRIAAEGMRFENGHSQPLCTPTRVKLMTGLHNYRNYREFMELDPADVTFAHVLGQAGYRTVISGKWQLTNNLYVVHEGASPQQAGFDEHRLWQLRREGRGSRYWGPTLVTNDRKETWGDDVFGPDLTNDFVLAAIDEHAAADPATREPLFVYYPMALPHDPFVTTPHDRDAESNQERFAAMVAYMDHLVGRVRAKLVEHELERDTLLLFIGDNGTSTRIASVRNGREVPGGKGRSLQTGSHVPFLAWWPGTIPAGQIERDPGRRRRRVPDAGRRRRRRPAAGPRPRRREPAADAQGRAGARPRRAVHPLRVALVRGAARALRLRRTLQALRRRPPVRPRRRPERAVAARCREPRARGRRPRPGDRRPARLQAGCHPRGRRLAAADRRRQPLDAARPPAEHPALRRRRHDLQRRRRPRQPAGPHPEHRPPRRAGDDLHPHVHGHRDVLAHPAHALHRPVPGAERRLPEPRQGEPRHEERRPLPERPRLPGRSGRQVARRAGGGLPVREGRGTRPRPGPHRRVHRPRRESAVRPDRRLHRAAPALEQGRSVPLRRGVDQAAALVRRHAGDPRGADPLLRRDHLHGRPARPGPRPAPRSTPRTRTR